MHILIGCTERIVAEKRVLDAVARSMDQEMVILNQLMLKSSGVEILRGPLVLVKADVVGTPEPELISQKSIYGSDPKLRLEPISAPGVWGAWNLIIGEENPRCIPVCDFISAGDEFKSLGMRFNLWF